MWQPMWVKPFEQQTGCQVHNKDAGTSDEMVQLMRTGQYDGVSASGNATERLVDAGNVSPVNVNLVPNYKTVFPDIKNQPYNTFGGVHYGIPHGRGANLLMWNAKKVHPAPLSWAVILDPKQAAKYKGKISAYNDPIYIADAAVYLKAHDPSLGITNPYELDSKQFNAAVHLLKQQRPYVGEYWGSAAQQIQSYASGNDLGRHHVAIPVLPLKSKHAAGRDQPRQRRLCADRGGHGVVGHVDDLLAGQAPQLHVQVDELDHLAEGQRRGGPVLRRGAGAESGLPNSRLSSLRPRRSVTRRTRRSATSTTRVCRRSGSACTTGRRRSPTAETAAATNA